MYLLLYHIITFSKVMCLMEFSSSYICIHVLSGALVGVGFRFH